MSDIRDLTVFTMSDILIILQGDSTKYILIIQNKMSFKYKINNGWILYLHMSKKIKQ